MLISVNHRNMRLIDAKMVTWDSARWMTLDVTDAIKRIVTRGRRNGGFEVHVRDTEENVLDAKTVIDPTVCTFRTGKCRLFSGRLCPVYINIYVK